MTLAPLGALVKTRSPAEFFLSHCLRTCHCAWCPMLVGAWWLPCPAGVDMCSWVVVSVWCRCVLQWQGLAEDGDLEGILGLVREIKRGPSAGPDGARAEFVAQVMSTCKLDRVAYTAVIDACLAVGATAGEHLSPPLPLRPCRSCPLLVACQSHRRMHSSVH